MKRTILTVALTAVVILGAVYLYQNFSVVKKDTLNKASNNVQIPASDLNQDTNAKNTVNIQSGSEIIKFTPTKDDYTSNGCLMYKGVCYVKDPTSGSDNYVPEGVDFYNNPEAAEAADAEITKIINDYEEKNQ